MQRNKALISGRDGEIQRVNPVELSTRQWLMKILYEEISQSLPSQLLIQWQKHNYDKMPALL